MKKGPKSLVKEFTWVELCNYIENHQEYEVPSIDTAMSWNIDDLLHDSFWINDTLGGYCVIYNKRRQHFSISHPNIKHYVVLKRKEIV